MCVCFFFVFCFFFPFDITSRINHNESSHREYHVACVAGAGFWLAFIERARGKHARAGTFVVKSLKKPLPAMQP